MAKPTLLEIVQEILNEMDSDEVNSIDDTTESQQVANIVKSCYNEMIAHRNWPHTRKLMQLSSSVDSARPTYFRTPENIKEIIQIQYDNARPDDTRLTMRDVHYLYPDEFLAYTNNKSQTDQNIQTVTDFSGIKLLIGKDKPPRYWTSFDDDYIVMDSYQWYLEDTLMTSKSSVLAYVNPVWRHLDNAVPDLPIEAFPALIEEAKSTAFITLKQVTNEKAETKSQRQQRWLSRKAWRTHGGVRYDNYGRRSKK